MMVLPVDIPGHRPPKAHELGARRHGKEPAPRQEHPGNLAKAQARLSLEQSRALIKGEHPIEPHRGNDSSGPIKRSVPIAPAKPAG